jgi:hypothetical protein
VAQDLAQRQQLASAIMKLEAKTRERPPPEGANVAYAPPARPRRGHRVTPARGPGGPLTVRSEFSSIDGDCRQGSRLRRSRGPSRRPLSWEQDPVSASREGSGAGGSTTLGSFRGFWIPAYGAA